MKHSIIGSYIFRDCVAGAAIIVLIVILRLIYAGGCHLVSFFR